MAQERPTTDMQTNQNQGRREEMQKTPPTEPRRGELTRGEWNGSPFSFMNRFMSEMDRLFDDFRFGSAVTPLRGSRLGMMPELGTWIPQVDVFERDGQLVVHAELAGMSQEDLKVNVDAGVLTISGERQHAHEHEKGGVYQCERSYGTFRRSIVLPDGVETEAVKASFDNGVLEVTMPVPKQRQSGRSVPIGAKPPSKAESVKH